jgi:hypothetical protein
MMKNELTQNISTYMVQLLFDETPKLDGDLLLSELRKRCGKVDRLGEKEDSYFYAFPEHLVEYKDEKKIPAQILLAFPDKSKGKSDYEQSLQQSWGWKEAKSVVNTCTTELLLTEMMAYGLDYKTRISLFHNALESVLSITPCKAVHWTVCQHFINPIAYLEARKVGSSHPLQFALNVRFFNISNKSDEMLMDTMGLSIFGLPDIQCHFTGLEPNTIARSLYNTAYYIFDNGDVIEDGQTVAGINPNDKWKCMHEVSLAAPTREVLDINPGKLYTTGNRN